MDVRHATNDDGNEWLELRHLLWADASREELKAEVESFLAGTAREPQAVLIAKDENGRIIGFAELSIRPYAEGCSSGRVAFLEGWYVRSDSRRRGVGEALVAAAERWGVAKGCDEFASDTQADNEESRAAHVNCGFTEVGVIRCFRKTLPSNAMRAREGGR